MSPAAARTDRELQMLEAMVDCAHELGMVFGEAAKAQADTKRSLELFDAFQKSFLAVRMGIRLSMTLRAPPKAAPATAPERLDALDRERAEHDPPERLDSLERERERDYEPVSLPKFLSTLGVVARDAARLDDLPPAAARVLPTVQALLTRADSDPPVTAPPAVVALRPPQGAARHRLLGSAAPPRPSPRASPPWPGSG